MEFGTEVFASLTSDKLVCQETHFGVTNEYITQEVMADPAAAAQAAHMLFRTLTIYNLCTMILKIYNRKKDITVSKYLNTIKRRMSA